MLLSIKTIQIYNFSIIQHRNMFQILCPALLIYLQSSCWYLSLIFIILIDKQKILDSRTPIRKNRIVVIPPPPPPQSLKTHSFELSLKYAWLKEEGTYRPVNFNWFSSFFFHLSAFSIFLKFGIPFIYVLS